MYRYDCCSKQEFTKVLSHTALMVPVCHGFGGKIPSYGEWKAGHQGGGAVLYIYLELVWRRELESVCQTGYNCLSVSTYLIGSGFYLGSQN